jgi:hypothetical protein
LVLAPEAYNLKVQRLVHVCMTWFLNFDAKE